MLKLCHQFGVRGRPLQEKLKLEFHLKLPDLPEAEKLEVAAYFTEVEQLIADQPRWCVRRDQMTLWFFTFAKFLMFRDLQPDAWAEVIPTGRGRPGPRKDLGRNTSPLLCSSGLDRLRT